MGKTDHAKRSSGASVSRHAGTCDKRHNGGAVV